MNNEQFSTQSSGSLQSEQELKHEYELPNKEYYTPEEVMFLERVAKLVKEMKENDLYLAEVKAKCEQARKEIKEAIQQSYEVI